MSEADSHQSQVKPGQVQADPNRAVLDLIGQAMAALGSAGAVTPLLEFASDSERAGALSLLNFNSNAPVQFGKVVYSLPYCNSYRVQLDRVSGTKWCCMAAESSFIPMGVRSTSAIPPGSRVAVWTPHMHNWAVILGVIPSNMYDPNLSVPDWITQGGGSGIKRERCYTYPFTNMFREGGAMDFSSGRPLDGTTLEWGKMSDTGIGIMIDPFQAYLRVNEACGLFLNYFDSYTRLAGVSMDIQSAVHEETIREDEGESQYFRGIATYPWEAVGMFKCGEEPFAENSDEDAQILKHVGKIDLGEGLFDQQPIYRHQEYGGYLGQGFRRTLLAPGRTEGSQNFIDDPKSDPDFGVFAEGVALDGAHWVCSAKGIYLIKRSLIPIPKQMRLPEDQKEGDDKEKDNYRFSGKFADSDSVEKHKVGDIEIEADDDLKQLLTVAGIFDIVSYHLNWKGLHPFHYHKEDYIVPEEGDTIEGGPTRTQEKINFSTLDSSMYLGLPEPKMVKIDDRYEDVEYYEREAGIALLPDGGIVIYDGSGGQITMTGGSIRFDCPGDLHMMPGRNVVMLGGDDIVMRARTSVDVSAGEGDVRVKAEKNMQILAGNSGQGGVLIESKGSGFDLDFDNQIGEDVKSAGIMLKASQSTLVGWAGDIYMRTGGDNLKSGRITLDASKGNQPVIVKAGQLTKFLRDEERTLIGPVNDNSTVSDAFIFDSSGAHLPGRTEMLGALFVDGVIQTTSSVQAKGSIQATTEPKVQKLGEAAASIQRAQNSATERQQEQTTIGKAAHNNLFTKGLYAEGKAGDDKTIEQAEFSYRDDDTNEQYNTADFKLIESRWQSMVRLDMATGGIEWDEPTVSYQGQDQLPWPGKAKWNDEATLQQLSELTMFDAAEGRSKDRGEDGGPYTAPKLGTLSPVPPKQGYKVIG